MIITIGSHKGGCGKSTIATNLAVILQEQGYEIILVDADAQKTASQWSEERESKAYLKPVNCISKAGNLKHTLKDLNSKYDIVIVDVAGRNSSELAISLLVSDYLLMPCRASQFDLNTLPEISEKIAEVQDFNEKLKNFAFLSSVPSNQQSTEVKESREVFESFPEFTLLNHVTVDRKAYREAGAEGLSVVESKDKKAKEEAYSLVNEFMQLTKTQQSKGVETNA